MQIEQGPARHTPHARRVLRAGRASCRRQRGRRLADRTFGLPIDEAAFQGPLLPMCTFGDACMIRNGAPAICWAQCGASLYNST